MGQDAHRPADDRGCLNCSAGHGAVAVNWGGSFQAQPVFARSSGDRLRFFVASGVEGEEETSRQAAGATRNGTRPLCDRACLILLCSESAREAPWRGRTSSCWLAII